MAGLVKLMVAGSLRPLPLLLPAAALAPPLFLPSALEEALLSFLLPAWTALPPPFSFAEFLLLISFPEVLVLAALAFALLPSFISNPRRRMLRQPRSWVNGVYAPDAPS